MPPMSTHARTHARTHREGGWLNALMAPLLAAPGWITAGKHGVVANLVPDFAATAYRRVKEMNQPNPNLDAVALGAQLAMFNAQM